MLITVLCYTTYLNRLIALIDSEEYNSAKAVLEYCYTQNTETVDSPKVGIIAAQTGSLSENSDFERVMLLKIEIGKFSNFPFFFFPWN